MQSLESNVFDLVTSISTWNPTDDTNVDKHMVVLAWHWHKDHRDWRELVDNT